MGLRVGDKAPKSAESTRAGGNAPAEGEEFHFASFFLSGTRFGVDVASVKEILGEVSLSSLSGGPDFVKGVIELRGMNIPVVDLGERFLTDPAPEGPGRIVVVLMEGSVLGLLVDEVTDIDVVSSPAGSRGDSQGGDDDETPVLPEDASASLKKCFVRVVKGDEGSALLIELDRLFSVAEKKKLFG